ncbi:unnamed protein product [Didymodactylos carnosus]|uniref:Uncharacterized protein n=1 Tax=Didymodactylos carnosus TaxID=1234261 RepID=A0A815FVH2_9BILA|nr:unnamed protein product [Didymodactylos carnosus]CAF1327841.1 unnamed protein product [Didymodactylos carnosus]CAF3997643.1 unnamed protein product [Didymodactylos carnosus]CAF4178919.1 unnamed protein product [Didymodactylos carnosus]
MSVDKLSDKQTHVGHKAHANIKSFKIEEQEGGNNIITLDGQVNDRKPENKQHRWSSTKQKKVTDHKKKRRVVVKDDEVRNDQTAVTFDDGETPGQPQVTSKNVEIKNDIGASGSEIENFSSEDEDEDLVDNCWDNETDDQGHYSEDNLSNEDDDEYVLSRDLSQT